MWPLVAWLLLFPLSIPAAELLTAMAGREAGTPSRRQLWAVLALYLLVAVLLALYAFLP